MFTVLAVIAIGVSSGENIAFAQNEDKKIKIAFLSDYGHVGVFEYAVEQFNQEQADLGTAYEIENRTVSIVENDNVVEIIKDLSNDGYTYFVGPLFSSNAEKAVTYADTQSDMVLISPSSTAPALSKSGDSLFRLVPDDINQGAEIAAHLKSQNKKHVVILYRNDVWGKGLLEAVENKYESAIKYKIMLKSNHTLVDHVAVATETESKVADLVSRYGADSVAILLITFNDNAINLVQSIVADSQITQTLGGVQWYGTDGIANSDSLIADNKVGRFLSSVNFAATLFTPEPNSINHLLETGDFSGDSTYRANVYDAVFLLADTFIVNYEEKEIDPNSTVKSLVLDVASGLKEHDHHHTSRTVGDGALGTYTLNESGDLASPLNYPLYSVHESSTGVFEWQQGLTSAPRICR